MTFDGKEYEIIRTLYRTKGSYNQILAEDISKEIREGRRTFYIVERDGVKYFVKEYTDREYGGNLGYPKNIEYEFKKTRELEGDLRRRNGVIGVPKAVAKENDRIMFEYLDGYKKPSPDNISPVHLLVYEWVKHKKVNNYDLNTNNILVKSLNCKLNGVTQYDVRMIDFEYSADRNLQREYGFE